MKKLIFALAVAFAMSGCAQLQTAYEVAQLTTKSYTNPVTKDDLYKIEEGLNIAFVALNTYKKSCAQGVADTHCKANVAAIQAYTRQVPPLLGQLRSFVKSNDQINAASLYNQIITLIANLRAAAQQSGVNVGI